MKVSLQVKRAIFQTFWNKEGCAKFLFFELETSNFGFLLLIFSNFAKFQKDQTTFMLDILQFGRSKGGPL